MTRVPPLTIFAVAAVATSATAIAQTATGDGLRTSAVAADQGAERAAGAMVMLMRQVCLPLVQGGRLKAIASAAGLRNEHGHWIHPIDRRQHIELATPDPTNPRLCSATIIHEVGAQSTIRQALDNWARSQTPPLQAIKSEVQAPGPLYLRTTSTWSGSGPNGVIGVVFAGEKTLKGKPVDGDLDQSELLESVTPSIAAPMTGAMPNSS